ncbi:hypothetical protein [Micrococcus sp.]|uniref:hypothetical protein n=1 Tax=Micrococcus sp. TaxID=1271 RepID=UPI002A90D654|nr:hypothetical protein [Micrococcus sp.]MDY6055484.1 hypothetical protein [Micrococcus sp.]
MQHGMDTTGLLTAGEHFTDGELAALASRGTLVALTPGVYATAEAATRPEARAVAVWTVAAPVLAPGWTALGPTAAWIHAGGAAPGRLHAAVAHFHRLPAGGAAQRWRLVETDVAASAHGPAAAEQDVVRIGPARVTSVPRTVEDLLLTGRGDDAARAAVLIARHGAADLPERLDRRRRRRGAVEARRRLAQILTALEAGTA